MHATYWPCTRYLHFMPWGDGDSMDPWMRDISRIPCVRTKRRGPPPHLHAWGRYERPSPPPCRGGMPFARARSFPQDPGHCDLRVAVTSCVDFSTQTPPPPSVVTSPRYFLVLRPVLGHMRSCRQATVDHFHTQQHIFIETCFIGDIVFLPHSQIITYYYVCCVSGFRRRGLCR